MFNLTDDEIHNIIIALLAISCVILAMKVWNKQEHYGSVVTAMAHMDGSLSNMGYSPLAIETAQAYKDIVGTDYNFWVAGTEGGKPYVQKDSDLVKML